MNTGDSLSAYLARIGHAGCRKPTLAVLRDIHALHPAAIAFEGLDPFLGRPVDLDPSSIQARLVHGRGGGSSSWETIMAVDEPIRRLNRELSRHSLGPVTTIFNQIVASLASGLQSLATWLRDTARDRPLITLLLAFQAGYAVARLGRRNARR